MVLFQACLKKKKQPPHVHVPNSAIFGMTKLSITAMIASQAYHTQNHPILSSIFTLKISQFCPCTIQYLFTSLLVTDVIINERTTCWHVAARVCILVHQSVRYIVSTTNHLASFFACQSILPS